MRRWAKRLLRWLAGLAVAVVLGLVLFAVWFVRRPWPQVEGEIAVTGLGAPVEVIRDRWGVPHLFAATEADLFFAQGYVHAQDRLWQMDFNRRVGRGALASLLGPPLLDTDRLLRTLSLLPAAERDWELAGAEERALLEAYAAGVNRFIETHRGRLPIEFTLLGAEPAPWTPLDSLVWGKLMSLNLSLNHPMEILRLRLAAKVGEAAVAELLPPYPADGPVIVPGAAPSPAAGADPTIAAVLARSGVAWGSNSWVIAGSRTASGKPILANDTHLGLQMPSAWYEIGLHGGRFDAVGFSFPGLPLVVIGQNRRLAWGITNMCSDVQDLYLERLDDREHPRRYEFAGQWHDLAVRRETLEVKGTEPVLLEVLSTRHGPLVNGVMAELKDAEPMALAWTAHGGSRLLAALRGVNLAASWSEFRAALAGWDVPSVNFTYADVDGNIGYQGTGRVPLRSAGHSGLVPVPGWTGAHEWRGFIPFAELPSSFNPPAGFLVTANNRTVGDGYPYPIAYDMADPYRARRIHDTLGAGTRLGVEDVRRLHADLVSIPALELKGYLAGLAPADEREREALAAVAAWDGRADPGSVGAGVYQAWFAFLWEEIFADELGEELAASYRLLGISQVPVVIELMRRPEARWFDDGRTAATETRDDIGRRAFARAMAWLAERHGVDPSRWRWGRLHRVRLAHAPLGQAGIGLLEAVFNGRAFEAPGDVYTVNETLPDWSKPFDVVFGVAQRYIADLGDLSRSLAVNSSGQCAHAFHRHREDQTPLWLAVDYHPVVATREAAEEAQEALLRLVPPR